MMEVVVTTGRAKKAAVKTQDITTNNKIQLFAGWSPSCHQTNSVKALKGSVTIHELSHPKLTSGLPT